MYMVIVIVIMGHLQNYPSHLGLHSINYTKTLNPLTHSAWKFLI